MEQLQIKISAVEKTAEVEKTLIDYSLKWNLLRCTTTEGGKSICGARAEKRIVCKMDEAYKLERHLRPMVYSLCYSSAAAL